MGKLFQVVQFQDWATYRKLSKSLEKTFLKGWINTMTEKARRIENALTKMNLQDATEFTVVQLEELARLANVHMYEIMIYVRYR